MIIQPLNEVNQICDTLCDQESKNIRLFDINRMAQNNAFPLTYQGFLTDTPVCYPDLVQPSSVGGYLYNDPIQYGKARIVSSESQNGNWINVRLKKLMSHKYLMIL